MHTWLVPHALPQFTVCPHAFEAVPQVAAPQLGAGHVSQEPATQWVAVGQPLHVTLPLPHALATLPHLYPASAFPHSGGGGLQTPSMHCWPLGQLQLIELPHTSPTVPQRCVVADGVQVSGAQLPEPASVGGCVTHALLMQTLLPVHPPQLIGMPQPSMPMIPQLLVQVLGWHTSDPLPPLAQTCPPVHGEPQTMALPVHGSTYRPQWYVEGHAVAGTHAASSPPPLLPPSGAIESADSPPSSPPLELPLPSVPSSP
jgi:hypothetical protein